MGLLEGYFVPLYNFFLTPENFDQKVKREDFFLFFFLSTFLFITEPDTYRNAPFKESTPTSCFTDSA